MRAKPVVAIDGGAGSGKSTVARLVAEALGWPWLDTGQMYRAVAVKAARGGVAFDDAAALAALAESIVFSLEERDGEWVLLADGEDLRAAMATPLADEGSSKVAVLPGVRRALVESQRRMGREGGIVVAGRDIQTVVFPDAEVKVFLQASPEVRAERRARQRGLTPTREELKMIADDIRERDARDSGRATAPLRAAEDALVVSAEAGSAEQIAGRIVAAVRERMK